MTSPREILSTLRNTDAMTVAVSGCSKNAGKTTAMNVLTAEWTGHGLMSIGIDGEDADFWLGVPKPRIAAAAGTVFATAERALGAATAETDVLERTGIATPLGEIVIARTSGFGMVLCMTRVAEGESGVPICMVNSRALVETGRM